MFSKRELTDIVWPLVIHRELILRWGLGGTILLAGLHKLVAPDVWAAYTAPVVVTIWPVSLTLTMIINGAIEIPFGLLVIVDRWTTVAAGIIALSLIGVLGNFGLVLLQTGEFVDIAIRDVGLVFLALAVMSHSLEKREAEASP